MARVKYQKARKDYPAAGIKKGDSYYYARIKTGPRSSREIRSLTPIRQSQLTTSDYLSQAYALQERFEDLSVGIAELAEELNGIAEEARSLGEEQNEKFNNMPDSLQQGDTGQLLEERAAAMEAWADSLENAAGSAEEKATEFEENQRLWTAYDEELAEYEAKITRVDNDESDDEEPEEPEEERMEEDDVVQEILGEVDQPEIG